MEQGESKLQAASQNPARIKVVRRKNNHEKETKTKKNKKQRATANEGTIKEAKPNCESIAEEDSRSKHDKEGSNDNSK